MQLLFKVKLGCLFLLLWCFPISPSAQPEIAEIKHFGKAEGLAPSRIAKIFQDENGLLWFLAEELGSLFTEESESKVIRFDGRAFQTMYNITQPDPVLWGFYQAGDNQTVINYNRPFFDVLNTLNGHFERIKFDNLFGEELEIWGSLNTKVQPVFGIKTPEKIWLTEWNGRLDTLRSFPYRKSQYKFSGIFQVEDTIWLSHAGIGLIKYNRNTRQWKKYTVKDIEGIVASVDEELPLTFAAVDTTSNGDLIFSMRGQFRNYFKYNSSKDKFDPIPQFPGHLDAYIPYTDKAGRTLLSFGDIGISRGLWLLDVDGKFIDYSHVLQNVDTAVYCFFSNDFSDHIWLGTEKGLTYLKLRAKEKKVEQMLLPYSMRNIIELAPGKTLFTTELNGWFLWEEAQDALLPYNIFQGDQLQNTNYCRGIFLDEAGRLWASNNLGVLKVNVSNRQCDFFESSISIQAFIQLQNGHFLMAGNNHPTLVEFDPVKETFSDYMALSEEHSLVDKFCHSLLEAADGIVWVGTNKGLLKFDKAAQKTRLFARKGGFESKVIMTIHEEPDGKLWLGTGEAGVHIFDPKTEQLSYLQEKDGLVNSTVAGILKDAEGDMWFSTFNGLSCYKPETETFLNFNTQDGFSHFEFNRHSFYQKPDGRLCFGTINGMNLFAPRALKGKRSSSKLVLLEAQFYDRAEGQQKVRYFNQSQLATIKLPPHDRYFRLRFALSEPEDAHLQKFTYFLEGFDEGWSAPGPGNEFLINKLPAGNYSLHVRGINARGELNINPVRIEIKVRAYFYKTAWFYLLCVAIVGLGGFMWILHLRTQKQHLEVEVARRTEDIRKDKLLIEQQATQLKELDRFKSRFYTNITHEFRTPLTVIIGMLEEIKGHEKSKKLIRRNSQNLLNLINQLLDLSKIESGKIKVNLTQGDIVHYIQYLAESFHSLAASRNIRLQTYCEMNELFMAFDMEKIRHVVGNLLSNAIKFTPDRGKITLHLATRADPADDRSFLLLKVKDNGVGIHPEKLPLIFDLFYQADDPAARTGKGSGIGLALVKELVELMDGHIAVESEVGKGTSFEVRLPIVHFQSSGEDALAEMTADLEEDPARLTDQFLPGISEKSSYSSSGGEARLQDSGQPILLIIEDNADVVTYIQSCLRDHYQLAVAYDGREGIDKAIEIIPDLIVSDVMMPEKDGYEVCRTLKKDVRTSHIPIVLLTAKVDVASRIEGLEQGADAYLAKPFDREELLVRLKKLNELRRQLQAKYGSTGKDQGQISPDERNPLEEAFLQKLRNAIEKNIDDPGLGVVHLCRAVHLSHPQVYRKIKALTGQSPSVFIRSTRLQKGLELLKNKEKTVADVAYEVGFSDPNYFSRTFHEHFGKTPSEMRN